MTNDNSINFWVNSDIKYESSLDISNPLKFISPYVMWELISNSPINKNKMKASYKLIKTYPNSPLLGTIEDSNYNNNMYPEFWKKIILSSYEILEVNLYNKKLPLLETWTPDNKLIPLKQVLKGDWSVETNHYYISKVKRISDSEVFTIGDKIDRRIKGGNSYKNTDIKGFSISDKDELIVSLGKQIDDTYYGSKGCNLSIISHSKEEKMLTTEDGVDIFNFQDVYFIVENWATINNYNVYYTAATKSSTTTNNLYFSTKEKAQEYIKINKPLFKTEDGVNMFKGQKCWILDKVHNYDYYSFILDNTHISGKNMFSTKEKVEDYVLHNKPCLSLNDVKRVSISNCHFLSSIMALVYLKLEK